MLAVCPSWTTVATTGGGVKGYPQDFLDATVPGMTEQDIRWLAIRRHGSEFMKRLHAFPQGKRVAVCGAGDSHDVTVVDTTVTKDLPKCIRCTAKLR
jgi:hypothetical protein